MALYNLRNPAVKRLMKEAEELSHPTEEYHAQPIEDNLFEWHFTLRGPPNTDYEGGIYHGRITLPPDYPMKPPSIILLTPNGRFETNKKICLSISGHHPESWQPSWSIRTALLAIIGFMPTHGNGALGSLDYTPEERQQLALKSQDWKCSECGKIKDIFVKKKIPNCQNESSVSQEIKSKSESYLNKSPNTVSNGRGNSILPEKCVSRESLCSDNETVLVNRHPHSSNPNQTEPELSKNDSAGHCDQGNRTVDAKEITSTQNRNNIFCSVLIFIIISIIMFLCLRRLFSM